MRTQHPRRRAEPLATQLLAFRDSTGAPLPLPPLFPTCTPEQEQLHERIYHVIALALRAYMQVWYAKISPRDRLLLPTINRDVVAPLLGPILADLTTPDGQERVLDLVLLHLPVLLASHLHTYWAARAELHAFGSTSPSRSLADAYHARMPVLATTQQSDGSYVLNPDYCGALVDALLVLRLPPRDLGAEAERIVIREVVARAVLGSVGKRLSAAWFYATIALKLLGAPGEPLKWRKPKPTRPASVLEKLHKTYSALMAFILLSRAFVTWLLTALAATSAPKAKYVRLADGPLVLARALLGADGRGGLAPPTWPTRIAFAAAEMLATLLSPAIDRLVPLLAANALTAANGLRTVDLVERLLFPDGWPGPPPIEPTPEEAVVLDADFRQRVHEALPPSVGAAFTNLPRKRAADSLVDVVADQGCNAHLVGILLTAIVAAIIPDLLDDDTDSGDAEKHDGSGFRTDSSTGASCQTAASSIPPPAPAPALALSARGLD